MDNLKFENCSVEKRNGTKEAFNIDKIKNALLRAWKEVYGTETKENIDEILDNIISFLEKDFSVQNCLSVEYIQDMIEEELMDNDYDVAKAYILYREKHKHIRDWADKKIQFIENYKKSDNTANATIDDNSNVSSRNIGIINSEIHKDDNIFISRRMVMNKLKQLYPDFDEKQYVKDLEHHIIYKHDESSFSGAIAPYCCSITMYPFLRNGIKDIGGLSAAPKNLDSFCGMYVNLIFAISAMFAGACASSEFLLYFTYFCKKEWGMNFWKNPDKVISQNSNKEKTIRKQIHQYWQQVIYSINQPAAARGLQSAFVNFSYFDKPFFEGMFGNFQFPDGTSPDWESLNWVQQEFMKWFNEERLRVILTFPVESYTLLYKDGEFQDKESAEFVAQEYARGHSFFTYISDTVDSLSSCCFSKDTKILCKSSEGIHWDTFENIKNIRTKDRKNFTIFHNGSWCAGKLISLPNRPMYKVTTVNNKEIIVSDNHLNPTLRGNIRTFELTTKDYLLFNTNELNNYPEKDEHLTYAQGFIVGAFLGDGSFGTRFNGGTIYDINFSQNAKKYQKCIENINQAASDIIGPGRVSAHLSTVHNNVYPVRVSSKELVAFIQKWTNWHEGTLYYNKELNMECLLQSYEFRKGILDGWYNTDGGNLNRCYTTSVKLKDCMEVLITSLGLNSIIDYSDRTDEKIIIRGIEYNRNCPLWCVRWYDSRNKRSMKDVFIWHNNSMYFRIKSIEPIEYKDEIYCCEMKNQDEPYFTLPNGIITHNCRLKNKIQTHEFSFTNGNIGVETGSKSVITLNLNRIIQDWFLDKNIVFEFKNNTAESELPVIDMLYRWDFFGYLRNILERVYKYHTAYNELLWDMYNADLLPVYKAGFIDLNRQYLTIGLNGLNEAAEFMGVKCNDNEVYKQFCTLIFSTIKEQNTAHKTKKTTFNTEQVPAESLAIKNYNWDSEDIYWTPKDRNLYASYIYIPSDPDVSVLQKLKLHGREYIGDYLDGGASAHIGLDHHLDVEQYRKLLKYAAEVGCQYFTFNVPNSECDECGFITKVPIKECPKCGSKNISYYDRIIGYLTKIKNWSTGRQIEQKTRIYHANTEEISI